MSGKITNIEHNFKTKGRNVEGNIINIEGENYRNNFKFKSKDGFSLHSSACPQMLCNGLYLWGNDPLDDYKTIEFGFDNETAASVWITRLNKAIKELCGEEKVYRSRLSNEVLDEIFKYWNLKSYIYPTSVTRATYKKYCKMLGDGYILKSTQKPSKDELEAQLKRQEELLERINEEFKEEKEELETKLKYQEAEQVKALERIEKEFEEEKKEAIKEAIENLDVRKETLLKSECSFIDPNIEKTIRWSYESRQPLLLIGPPGCGKNTILETLLTELSPEGFNDVVLLSLSGDITKDSLLGHYILDGDKTVWQDGPLAVALKTGKKIILDEINMCHADILAILNNLLQLKKDGTLGDIFIADNGGEKITPHPDSRIYATANPADGNAGTKELNQATLSRFISLNIFYLNKDDEAKLLLKKFPDAPISFVEEIIKKANKLRDEKRLKNITVDISTRHLIKVLSLYSAGLDKEYCLRTGILNDCQFEEDRNNVEQILFNIIF